MFVKRALADLDLPAIVIKLATKLAESRVDDKAFAPTQPVINFIIFASMNWTVPKLLQIYARRVTFHFRRVHQTLQWFMSRFINSEVFIKNIWLKSGAIRDSRAGWSVLCKVGDSDRRKVKCNLNFSSRNKKKANDDEEENEMIREKKVIWREESETKTRQSADSMDAD